MNRRNWQAMGLGYALVVIVLGVLLWKEVTAQEAVTLCRQSDDPPGTVRYCLLFNETLLRDGFEQGADTKQE